MTRVIARADGDWFLADVEGPRSLRSALRQNIQAGEIEHLPDGQMWRIHSNSWPTACMVFTRFEAPIVWARERAVHLATATGAVLEPGSPSPGSDPSPYRDDERGSSAPLTLPNVGGAGEVDMPREEEEAMIENKIAGFTVTITGNGLTAERAVDQETALSILATLLGFKSTIDQPAAAAGRLAQR